MENNCAVLILSCDKYSDLWEPFFQQFWKHWPNCPYKVYLGSNEVVPPKFVGVTSIRSGKDTDWATSYKKILQQISEPYIFVWMEDAFLTSQVSPKDFRSAFELLAQPNSTHIHFRPIPVPDSVISNVFGVHEKAAPYRTHTVGFWNKNALSNLLLSGENAWNFEIMGSYRSSYQDGYYSLLKPPFIFVHLVEKGRWIKDGLDYCRAHNIHLRIKERPYAKSNILNKLKSLYFGLVLKVPWKFRLKIMNTLRKLFASY